MLLTSSAHTYAHNTRVFLSSIISQYTVYVVSWALQSPKATLIPRILSSQRERKRWYLRMPSMYACTYLPRRRTKGPATVLLYLFIMAWPCCQLRNSSVSPRSRAFWGPLSVLLRAESSGVSLHDWQLHDQGLKAARIRRFGRRGEVRECRDRDTSCESSRAINPEWSGLASVAGNNWRQGGLGRTLLVGWRPSYKLSTSSFYYENNGRQQMMLTKYKH